MGEIISIFYLSPNPKRQQPPRGGDEEVELVGQTRLLHDSPHPSLNPASWTQVIRTQT